MSASYFMGAIALVVLIAIWISRNDVSTRRPIYLKTIALLMTMVVAYLGGRFLTPGVYRELGLASEVFWHRAFVGLGAHPDWPFGNLAVTMDCKADIPEGLLPGILDRDGHCAYFAAVRQGAPPGQIYGRQYESVLRAAFFRVVSEYPRKALETYFVYKPRMIWNTVSAAADITVSRQAAAIMISLGVQLVLLAMMIGQAVGGARRLLDIWEGFAVVGAFSILPPVFAWSTIATSADLICYVYVALGLLLATVASWMVARQHLDACKQS
jgi:hypothetical protein